MERPPRTAKQILATITAARDSVWVIDDSINKLNNGVAATSDIKGDIQRNVDHLKLIVKDQEVIDSGESITDLSDAIVSGSTVLSETAWIPDIVNE